MVRVISWFWTFFRSLFTEDDAGTVACPVRVFGGGGIIMYLWQGIRLEHFTGTELQTYATGLGVLIAALAGGIAGKRLSGADADKSATKG